MGISKLFFLLFAFASMGYGSSGGNYYRLIFFLWVSNNGKNQLTNLKDANLVTYVHDKITIDLSASAEVVVETQADRILLVTVESDLNTLHGDVYDLCNSKSYFSNENSHLK